jgi:hypothetical protein
MLESLNPKLVIEVQRSDRPAARRASANMAVSFFGNRKQ